MATAMLGHEAEWSDMLERAHYAYLESGETRRAVRCAFWIGIRLARAGEMGPATGWLGRAQRLLESEGEDCVERGYLMVPQVFAKQAEGDLEGAVETVRGVAEVAERFDDQDLLALAMHEQGHLLIRLGRVREGLAVLDESMVIATGGHLSPYVTGIVYCGTIAAYEQGTDASQAAKEHDRCGSNLVAPMLLSTLAGNIVVRTLLRARGPLASVSVALGSVALSVELFAWSERHRERPLARAFRRPGFEMQRLFATREPSVEQLEVGRAALAEILRLELDPDVGAR